MIEITDMFEEGISAISQSDISEGEISSENHTSQKKRVEINLNPTDMIISNELLKPKFEEY